MGVPCRIVYVFFQKVKLCKFVSNRTGLLLAGLSAFRGSTIVLGRGSASLSPCHRNQVVIADDLRARECSGLSSVDTGLESPRCEDIANLIACDVIGRMFSWRFYGRRKYSLGSLCAWGEFQYNDVFPGNFSDGAVELFVTGQMIQCVIGQMGYQTRSRGWESPLQIPVK